MNTKSDEIQLFSCTRRVPIVHELPATNVFIYLVLWKTVGYLSTVLGFIHTTYDLIVQIAIVHAIMTG